MRKKLMILSCLGLLSGLAYGSASATTNVNITANTVVTGLIIAGPDGGDSIDIDFGEVVKGRKSKEQTEITVTSVGDLSPRGNSTLTFDVVPTSMTAMEDKSKTLAVNFAPISDIVISGNGDLPDGSSKSVRLNSEVDATNADFAGTYTGQTQLNVTFDM